MKTRLLTTMMVLFFTTLFTHAQEVKQVSSTEVSTLLKKDKTLKVLDVRTAEEFSAGHIKGAINIDIRQEDALARIDKLDHNAKYIVHCRTNHRSKIAVDHMAQSGFKTVYQMSDGITGWSANNLPLTK